MMCYYTTGRKSFRSLILRLTLVSVHLSITKLDQHFNINFYWFLISTGYFPRFVDEDIFN